MKRVLVFGSLNGDVVATSPRLPAAGETVLGSSIAYSSGGKGGNQAVAAARISGAPDAVAMIGCVGEDETGGRLIAELEHAGVNVESVRRVAAPSGTAVITVDDEGENTIVVIPGANMAWPEGMVRSVPVNPGDVVLTQLEIGAEETARALSWSKSCQAFTVLNAAPAAELRNELLALVDLLIVNEGEAKEIFGVNDPDSPAGARAILERSNGATVVMTLGARGAVIVDPDGVLEHVPSVQVSTVDTVGAGDAFVGVLAAALAEDKTLSEAVQLANVAGALTTTVRGARYAELDRTAIEGLTGALR